MTMKMCVEKGATVESFIMCLTCKYSLIYTFLNVVNVFRNKRAPKAKKQKKNLLVHPDLIKPYETK